MSRAAHRAQGFAGVARTARMAIESIQSSRTRWGRSGITPGNSPRNVRRKRTAHWTKISDAVRRLEGMGVSTTDCRIAEAVGSVAAAAWPGPSTGLEFLADVIARALVPKSEVGKADPKRTSGDEREWSTSVLGVRELLRGKRMVIIGGERNAEAVQRLTQTFELKEAEWVELTEHGPGTPMHAPIYRPDTTVVIVIIKLTGHLRSEEAREYAAAAGKPCVMLSGGYNPERVAAEIMEQASARLK